MVEWRIIGVFCKPNVENDSDIVTGIQWNAQLSDYNSSDFPRYSQMSGTFTFTNTRLRSMEMTDDIVVGWMVEEGFDKDFVEQKLREML